MNVLVTSGGTVEKIDSVRSVTNVSTGRLGSVIADRFSKSPDVKRIYYMCSKAAVKPAAAQEPPVIAVNPTSTSKPPGANPVPARESQGIIEVIYADSVSDLETAVRDLFEKTGIDIIVHCMAVSDYKVKAVTTVSALMAGDAAGNLSDKGSKISSDFEDLALIMERTPKIISLFQELSPDSVLIAFKLLNDVPLETLIDRGFEVLTKNKCRFVLANDLKNITGEKHIGYLIDEEKNFTEYTTKAAIADAIVTASINGRRRTKGGGA